MEIKLLKYVQLIDIKTTKYFIAITKFSLFTVLKIELTHKYLKKNNLSKNFIQLDLFFYLTMYLNVSNFNLKQVLN